MNKMKIIECPRDAMQGIKTFIPTEKKIAYINELLKTGFDTIDFGSFVSPKAIPQMKDTAEVLKGLDLSNTKSKLLAIIANKKGAENAVQFDEITYLGYPFSVSETFQKRNTNATIEESLGRMDEILNLAFKHSKQLVVYLSMAFGNPYGDKWNPEIVMQWSEKLANMGIKILALSDTIGVAKPEIIAELFNTLIPEMPEVEFGAHFHTTPDTWKEKIESAYQAGCRRFDTAIKGYGGCPMANDELTGNMPTEKFLAFCEENNIETGIDKQQFNKCLTLASEIFPQ
ncbi:MAG TPA: hydroxymethylglutaryl-CoA lyase [Flavobacteriales bacterium]|nr:hydroxymethylglutaryl-CoA lyase [Flavobacteriales bacterium]